MIISEENYLAHYGIARKSGRYPWGSGGNETTRSRDFFSYIQEMRSKGLTDTEICAGIATEKYPFNTTDLRATKTIAGNVKKAAQIAEATRLGDKGLSNKAIGERMGEPGKPINESTVRALRAPGAADKSDRMSSTVAMLRSEVGEKGVIQIGRGVNLHVDNGVADNHLQTAVAVLKAEGYVVHTVQTPNIGSPGNKTLIKVLAAPGVTYTDIVKDMSQVKSILPYTDDNGRSFSSIQPPISISSKRVAVNYHENGGGDADGVIYVRPGSPEMNLGKSNYAQVRIMVDGTHYIKGMAMYKDDLPAGTDVLFNTNKSREKLGSDVTSALKPLKRLKADGDNPKDPGSWTGEVDTQNPFGSIVRQIGKYDKDGRMTEVTSAMNLVNEAGDWDKWSRTISAQVLSKQKPSLIKERLDESMANHVAEYDKIMALTNPAVRRKLLEAHADSLDSAAVHLKAAGLPGQRTKVILPMNSLKKNEIYAPTFADGTNVVLVRYPHGGKFEIPELTVNNRNRTARKILGEMIEDAVGINSEVAKQLSGADFDGDTVVVIPNGRGKIQTESPLPRVKNFDPQHEYPAYDGMPKLTPARKQWLMGDASNLITDMTIMGATNNEIAQAVRHSMVVIDAEKHNLNYKQSAIDNNIASLKTKYQGKANGGAATLISRASSKGAFPERKLQKPSEGGSIDPKTGKKIYRETGVQYPGKNKNGELTGKLVTKTSRVKKLEYADDAFDLVSGSRKSTTPQEALYANYSNSVKALANKTRLSMLKTGTLKYSDSAGITYKKEVTQLNAKLNEALRNAPRERQAQVIAGANIKARKEANPFMDKAEVKKLESLALMEARNRVGAKKVPVYIEDREWDAIQAGAVRPTKLKAILDNSDSKRVRELATPRPTLLMTTAKKAKAQRLMASGATQAEIANQLGVSLTTLKTFLNG